MSVLVTGGAGFIGSNYIAYLQKERPGTRIVCLDKLTYAGNLKTLKSAMKRENFRFVRGDIADAELVERLFEEERFDSVVNFAAESHVDRSIVDPGAFVRTNVVGTQVLLDACRAREGIRFHQVSTDEVYGDLPLDRPEILFTENTPICASSPYSASKAAADLLCMAYYRTYGLPVTVSRCSNNYGPCQFPEKMIPRMITCALQDQRLPVYARGESVRDWLYVEDHCTAIQAILEGGKPGEVYNVGGHNERRTMDVIKTILEALHKPESLIEHVADRPGHDMRYAIDPEKIARELGWLPGTKFEEGIQKTIAWYVDNRAWWEEVLTGEYRGYYERMCEEE